MMLGFLSLTGCATIIYGTTQSVSVNSSPAGAKVTVHDMTLGTQVGTQLTPAVFLLKRGHAYFRRANYRIVVEKEGYHSAESTIVGRPNGWYIAGNFLVGGLIGWLIVDPISGAMWSLDTQQVHVSLTPIEHTRSSAPQDRPPPPISSNLNENVSGQALFRKPSSGRSPPDIQQPPDSAIRAGNGANRVMTN